MGDGWVASEPQPKERRTGTEDEFQHDGPVEDEETARGKMEEAGFDPDDVTKECELNEHAMESFGLHEKMHPMTY